MSAAAVTDPASSLAVAAASEGKMTIESLSDTEETDPFGAVVRTYRAYWVDMGGRTSGPPLLFEARGDAARRSCGLAHP
jgi:hypothetical protein